MLERGLVPSEIRGHQIAGVTELRIAAGLASKHADEAWALRAAGIACRRAVTQRALLLEIVSAGFGIGRRRGKREEQRQEQKAHASRHGGRLRVVAAQWI